MFTFFLKFFLLVDNKIIFFEMDIKWFHSVFIHNIFSKNVFSKSVF